MTLVIEGIVTGAEGQGFDNRADQIGHSVINGSQSLRHFFEAVWSRRKVAEMGPATRYMLRRNTASIMKI